MLLVSILIVIQILLINEYVVIILISYSLVNSPFAHHNLFSRMHMGVRNDPSLGPVFSDSFSSTKKLKICAVSIMFSQPRTYNS